MSMEAIASRVGISAPALYRHYTGKYELFRDAVLSLGQQLVDCTGFADDADDDPRIILQRLIASLIDTAMANRESGGLYRWEGRYLRGDDQATLIAQMRSVHHRIQRPLCVIRPDLTSRQRWTLSTAVLSVVGSIVDHRAKLPAIQVRALLAELAGAVLTAELPGDDEDDHGVVEADASATAEPSRYEALLDESMRLFNLNGYRDTGMEDIAAAVGMPASGIYRYFSGKSDILAAAFRRAADRLSADTAAITATSDDPQDALTAIIDAYVARSFDQPELDYVYFTERLNMSVSDQKILRNMSRSTVETWVELVVAVRPDWTAGQARFAVHAAMSLVVDLGRLMRYERSTHSLSTVERLLDLTLLGHYRLRATLPAT